MDSRDDQHVFLQDLRFLSVDQLPRYTGVVSPPFGTPAPHLVATETYSSELGNGMQDARRSALSGAISVPICAPAPHGVQTVDSMVMADQLSNLAIGEMSFVAAPGELHTTTLPNELILKILTHLHWRDIVRWRYLCRWIRDEVDHSVKFQYLIALGLSAMEDGAVGELLTSADRLRLLNAQQQAWRNLAWRKIVPSVPFNSFVSFKFSEGMMLLCPTTDSQSLEYLRLPDTEEVEDGVELKWSQMKLGFDISDFTLDVEQDLFVPIETASHKIRFHFWMLSTRIPHPAASNSIFEYPCRPGDRYCASHISGSHIVILFGNSSTSENDRLLVHSWTTGYKRAYVEAPPKVSITSFTFISPYVFVIPSEVTLDLYSFDPEWIIDPEWTIDTVPILSPVVSFHLPPRCYPDFYFVCQSFPYPREGLSHPKSDGNDILPLAPFSTDREDGILVFCLRSTFAHRLGPGSWFVVHRSALLSYLVGWGESQGVKNVFWDDWGPRNTRWFEDRSLPREICDVHGHRLILQEFPTSDNPDISIVVLDFNPAAVSKALTRSVASDLIMDSTPLDGGRIFKTDIQSGLPYLETRMTAPFISFTPAEILMDDQRILLFQEANGDFQDCAVLFL